MPIRSTLAALALTATVASAPASATSQDLGSLLGSAGGGLVPGLGTAGVGNAAGLLGYCLKNKYLGGVGATGASGLLGKLTGQPGVKTSPGYLLGQQGKVEQPTGNALSLGSLSTKLKSKACDVVLQRAGSFL